jgi:hypothetical protein
MLSIAVLTPSLPDRGEMLAEAVESVRIQTARPSVHAIGVDYEDIGIGRMLNRLAAGVEAEWLARLDDDDLFKPNHLEVLASGVEAADVVYTWCDVVGRSANGVTPPVPAVLGPAGWMPNQDFDEALLRQRAQRLGVLRLEVVTTLAGNPPQARLLFLNGWNEWAEGNHLEPDLVHRLGWLQAVRRVALEA